MDLTQLAPFANIGAGGLLAIVVLFIILGRLRPKSWSDEIIELHKQRAEDAIAALDKRDAQFDALLEAVETGNKLLEALTQAAERNRP